jgi:hypothetical protein
MEEGQIISYDKEAIYYSVSLQSPEMAVSLLSKRKMRGHSAELMAPLR